MNKEEKLKAIAAMQAGIEKDYGKGSFMTLGAKPILDVPVVSSGSIKLDLALGVMGYPYGRIMEIYGPESSGKTTLAIHAIAEAQKQGGICAFIDVEHAFDREYAKSLGVNIDDLYISQPSYGEEALEITDRAINTGAYSVVVVDSVAALVPKGELEGEMGESKIGLQARLMSQALRKLTPAVSKTNTLVIFINQLREKIGVMFGSPETTSGGNALKFYSSIRLDVRKVTTNKEDDVAVSNKIRVKVIKNKLAPPFKQAEFNILFGVGIDKFDELIELAIDMDIIKKAGSWLTYKDIKIQGVDKLKQLIEDNDELKVEIENIVKQKIIS